MLARRDLSRVESQLNLANFDQNQNHQRVLLSRSQGSVGQPHRLYERESEFHGQQLRPPFRVYGFRRERVHGRRLYDLRQALCVRAEQGCWGGFLACSRSLSSSAAPSSLSSPPSSSRTPTPFGSRLDSHLGPQGAGGAAVKEIAKNTDVEGARARREAREVKPMCSGISDFILWGRTLGAAVAVLYTDELAKDWRNKDVILPITGLILDSPWSSLNSLVEEMIKRAARKGLVVPR